MRIVISRARQGIVSYDLIANIESCSASIEKVIISIKDYMIKQGAKNVDSLQVYDTYIIMSTLNENTLYTARIENRSDKNE